MNYKFEKLRLYGLLGDKIVRILKDHNCFIAGGAITSLFCNREINDYDVYFRSKEDFIDFIYNIWGTEHWITSSTDKATGIVVGGKQHNVQVIHFKFFESAEEIFNTFDFTACMGAYDFKTEEFILHDDFLRHNSQRVLSFNKETAFPIVSLLRVDKYKSKGYKISKVEMIKVALTCMELSSSIDSYDKLKEQIGGMYGMNYDKLFDGLEEGGDFRFAEAIDYLSEIPFDENIYENNDSLQFDSVEEFLSSVIKDLGWKYFEFGDEYHLILPDGEINKIDNRPAGCEEIEFSEFAKKLKICKFVQKRADGSYQSFYDKSFVYEIGKEVKPKGRNYLYFNNMRDLSQSSYHYEKDKTCIEVEFEIDDIETLFGYSNQVTLNKCRVLREVPEEEWREAVSKKNKQEDDWGLGSWQ